MTVLSGMRRASAAGYAAILLAFFGIAGGHWAVVQGIAWAGMIRSYSEESGSLVAGVKKALSGEAPCHLCERIAQAKQSEKQSVNFLQAEKKIELTLAPLPLGLKTLIPRATEYPDGNDTDWTSRLVEPPTPVPLHV